MKPRRFSDLLIIAIIATAITLPSVSYSQRASAKNNDISVDFVNFFVHTTLSAQYEWKVGPTSSWAARAYFVATGASNNNTIAFGLGAAYRFYILDSRALSGFTIAPAADIFFFKNSNLGKSKISFAIGGDAGYKWFFDQITVEPVLGFRDGFSGAEVIPGVNNFTSIYFTGSVYIGYAW